MNEVISNLTRLRESGNNFCQIQVELRKREKGMELAVTGVAGYIISRAQGRKEALQFWTDYFEQDKNAIHEMNKKCGFNCRTASGAAKKVIQTDGEFHGLDIHCTDGDRLFITTSCGQIVETLKEWFPECLPLLSFHLNGMNAGCTHQQKLGWKHGRTIALSPDDLTEAQRKSLDAMEAARIKPLLAQAIDKRKKEILASDAEQVKLFRRFKKTEFVSQHDAEQVRLVLNVANDSLLWQHSQKQMRKDLLAFVAAEVEIKPEPFTGAIYKDCIGAPCPECGYRYGTAWVHNELPADIVELAKSVSEWTVEAPKYINLDA